MNHSHGLLQLFMDINKQNAQDKKKGVDDTKNETNTLWTLCHFCGRSELRFAEMSLDMTCQVELENIFQVEPFFSMVVLFYTIHLGSNHVELTMF